MQRVQLSPNLAISESGFVFLPTTGESFTISDVGRVIIAGLQQNRSEHEIAQQIAGEYEVDAATAERDVRDFIQQLTTYRLAAVTDTDSSEQ